MESTLIFDRNKINREQRQALKAAELRLKKTGLLVGEQRNSSSIKPKDAWMGHFSLESLFITIVPHDYNIERGWGTLERTYEKRTKMFKEKRDSAGHD